MRLAAFFFPSQRATSVERYRIHAVTHAAELDQPETLPLDVRYVLSKRPEFRDAFQGVLKEGFGIGVRMVERTPGRILLAVDRIADESQERTVIPWLPRLLEAGEVPVFTREELARTKEQGVDLYQEAKRILEERHTFRKLVLIDLHDRRIREEHQELMRDANAVLAPLAMRAMVHRIVIDRSHAQPKVGQAMLKAAFFIAPIAHVLELWVAGIGKAFAAIADDLLSEAAELITLKKSGLTNRQITRRLWTVAPVFLIAGFAAFQVEAVRAAGYTGWAGALFGAAAALLAILTWAQSVAAYRAAYAALFRDGKITREPGQSRSLLAFRQSLLNVGQFGVFLGAMLAPFVGAVVFLLFPAQTSNGWLLAFTAAAQTILAGICVALSDPLERWWFRRSALTSLTT